MDSIAETSITKEHPFKLSRIESEAHTFGPPTMEHEDIHFKSPTLNAKEVDIFSLEQDSGLRPQT